MRTILLTLVCLNGMFGTPFAQEEGISDDHRRLFVKNLIWNHWGYHVLTKTWRYYSPADSLSTEAFLKKVDSVIRYEGIDPYFPDVDYSTGFTGLPLDEPENIYQKVSCEGKEVHLIYYLEGYILTIELANAVNTMILRSMSRKEWYDYYLMLQEGMIFFLDTPYDYLCGQSRRW